MKENFNLKEIITHPITIYKFGKYNLPFGVSLVRLIVGIVILVLMLLFRNLFLALDEIMEGLALLSFVGIPFLLSGYLVKQTYEGKKIHYYLYDFFKYFFTVYLSKRKYCNDEVVEYMNEKEITMEPIQIQKESESEENAIKERVPRRLPEPYVNSKRGDSRAI